MMSIDEQIIEAFYQVEKRDLRVLEVALPTGLAYGNLGPNWDGSGLPGGWPAPRATECYGAKIVWDDTQGARIRVLKALSVDAVVLFEETHGS